MSLTRSPRVRPAVAAVLAVLVGGGCLPSSVSVTVPPSGPPVARSTAASPSPSPTVERSPTPSPVPTPSPAPTPSPTPAYRESGPIALKDCRDVVIEGLVFRDLGKDVMAIHLDRCRNVTIRNVVFIRVAEGVYAERSRNIKVVDSRYEDITGPSKRRKGINVANFVQFDRVNGGLIARNVGRGGDTEDIVSLYKTSNVIVEDNHFEGIDWTSGSGSGIALGDSGGHDNTARRNILLNPGQVGVFIAGGTGHRIVDNIVYGEQRPGSNVGMYVWNQHHETCSGNAVARNQVFWVTDDGNENPFWNAGDCGTVRGTSTNTFEAFDPEPFRVPPLDPALAE